MSDPCSQFRLRLVELLARADPDDPEEEGRQLLRQHVDQCEACRDELDGLRGFLHWSEEALNRGPYVSESSVPEAEIQLARARFLSAVKGHPEKDITLQEQALRRPRGLFGEDRVDLLKRAALIALNQFDPTEVSRFELQWQRRLHSSVRRLEAGYLRPALEFREREAEEGGSGKHSDQEPMVSLIDLAFWLEEQADLPDQARPPTELLEAFLRAVLSV